jgi:alkylation response protein AidB-like acyl-CoA dehydrogenase
MNTVAPSVNWSQVSGPLPNDLTEATFEWNLAVGAAHRAMATELIAVTDEALRITLHAAETQAQACAPEFSPSLSDAFADLEAARRVLADSWRFGGLLSGQVAKAISGRAHRKMCDAAEEICGAVGDAPKRDLHRYVARGLQLDALCGSYRYFERLLAADRLFDECAPASGLDTTIGLGSPNSRAKVP